MEKVEEKNICNTKTSKNQILSKGKTTQLFIEMKAAKGEKKKLIREKIILSNLGLAGFVAKKFLGRGFDYEDLKAECEIWLIDSVDRYDYKNGAAFSTFAINNIIYNLRLYLRDHPGLVKVPPYFNDLMYNYERIKSSLSVELGKTPTAQDIAEKLEVSLEKIYELEVYAQPLVYLDSPVSKDDDESSTYLDYLFDEETEDSEEDVADKFILKQLCDIIYDKEKCKDFLNSIGLSEKDFEILKIRCGFYKKSINDKKFKAPSYQKIADDFGFKSKQTAKDAEKRAIKKLREVFIASRNKKDFPINKPNSKILK